MNIYYAQTVRLLLTAAPDVFANDIFAMKGGTAINLFVQDMPRLSVDIEVVYVPWATPRDEAMQAIANELDAITGRLSKIGLKCRAIASKGLSDTKLIIALPPCRRAAGAPMETVQFAGLQQTSITRFSPTG